MRLGSVAARQMRRGEKFTVARVIAALRDAEGVDNRAAKVLGCSPSTIKNYCERHPEITAAKRQALEAWHAELNARLEASRPAPITKRVAAMKLNEAMAILSRSPRYRR